MSNKPSKDLQGLSRLTVDAIKGISDVVESLHQSIANFIGLPTDQKNNRTTGLSGMVYRNIHGITEIVGDGIDGLLNKLGVMAESQNSSPNREAILA
ncbi:MAG: alpha/beta hydrolase, partial [Proteobacteria bacterium]|nr:alpha/beta hydrolase [Pseudomonadota bacterium]